MRPFRNHTALVAVALSFVAPLLPAAQLQFGPITIEWLDGFSTRSGSGPIAMSGPHGEELLISTFRSATGVSPEEAARRAQRFAETQLPKSAARAGEIKIPLERVRLDSGTALLSIGSSKSYILTSNYFLQYMLVSPNGRIALFTIEGRGDVEKAHRMYRPLFESVRWSEQEDPAQMIPTDKQGFTDHLAERLRAEVGNAVVSVKGPLTLGLGELQANLDRVYLFCQRNPDRCAEEVSTYVTGAAEVHRERTAAPTREAVRLVVRTSLYVDQAQKEINSSAATLMPRPLVEGLVVVPVLDSPRAVRMLDERESEALGLTSDEVHSLGAVNLRSSLPPLMSVAKVAGKGQIGHLTDNFFHPSRLVLHDSWAPLAEAQGGTLIVVAPATDVVLYISEDSTEAIAALRALARRELNGAPNKLADVLLKWRPGGWEVVR